MIQQPTNSNRKRNGKTYGAHAKEANDGVHQSQHVDLFAAVLGNILDLNIPHSFVRIEVRIVVLPAAAAIGVAVADDRAAEATDVVDGGRTSWVGGFDTPSTSGVALRTR